MSGLINTLRPVSFDFSLSPELDFQEEILISKVLVMFSLGTKVERSLGRNILVWRLAVCKNKTTNHVCLQKVNCEESILSNDLKIMERSLLPLICTLT